MDINVRNVEPVAVKKLDELAKAKGMSRSQYMREMIESFTFLSMRDGIVDRLEYQLDLNTLALQRYSDSIEELVSVLKEMIAE
ncbi:ribbon-helix-helix protein, CopG family [Bacillus sp. V3B]|uniref:ribbon-helix-helix protein, CopG family n=1 Tax=Bacillus sp. V3B TaxID=2804915 RepID=UPI00210D98F1|nr:ribbon-helix-helix protein, CopG family [Bacillus sp. V3B]MCQ6276406.1 ribbon-helix-helix protein, CopG family [Bacillus sp. V3B]